jgi:acylphosphatase
MGRVRRCVEVIVAGRVQGVSFRAYAEQEANRLGVRGWVRNEPDGSVAGHFEGDRDAVDALVGWCRHGPAFARVERVDVRAGNDEGATSFEVRG